jgi:dynein heavy chain
MNNGNRYSLYNTSTYYMKALNLYTQFYYFQDYPLNPKALSLGELYGEFDLNTNEWTDGVLSSVMRQTCAG